MAYLLRKIKGTRWIPDKTWPQIDSDDFHSDPLSDLNTTAANLSVYLVEDDLSDLELVVKGLAANTRASRFDYILIAESSLSENGYSLSESLGETPYTAANRRHRDITNLTARTLVSLGKLMMLGSDRNYIPKKDIKKLIKEAVETGEFEVRDEYKSSYGL